MSALIGVGVGPGDPELVTARATRVLRTAGRVFAPTTAIDAVGRAESIVRQACPGVRIDRLVFDMGAIGDERRAGYCRAADQVLDALGREEVVAVAVLGDPNVYSTFSGLAAEVRGRRPEVTVETVPGIMAFQELAARARTVLLDGTERLSLVTALDGPAAVDGPLAAADGAVVVYKGGRHLPAIADRLASTGRLDGAVVGELLGLPGERVLPAAEAAALGPAAYLATVIVPPVGRRRV
ncbi:MAG: precorrin-2 C(20)-methyltransferase [Acidimicrobiales bacterium]